MHVELECKKRRLTLKAICCWDGATHSLLAKLFAFFENDVLDPNSANLQEAKVFQLHNVSNIANFLDGQRLIIARSINAPECGNTEFT